MRTLDDAVDQFVYHPATPETAQQHARARDLYLDLLVELWDVVPDGPEKTLAIRDLQRSMMMVNLAIAMQAPADTSSTRSVARVLPQVGFEVDFGDGRGFVTPKVGIEFPDVGTVDD
jgi:hypothetical protein